MKVVIRQLFIRLSLVTLLFGAAGMFIRSSDSYSSYYLPAFPLLLGIFFLLYFSFSRALLKVRHISPGQFINRFILLTGIKFFVLLAVIIFWLLVNRQQSVIFLGYVLVLYFGYSLTAYSLILSKKIYDN